MLEDASDPHPSTPSIPGSGLSLSTKLLPVHNLLAILPYTTRFIQEAVARKDAVNSRVLVHCDVGKSVSAAVVLGYLIRVHYFSYEKALEFLKEKRRITAPHPIFVRQLKEWEQRVRLELESDLERGLSQRAEEQRLDEEGGREGRCESFSSRFSEERYRWASSHSPTLPSTPPSSPPPASLEPG